MTDPRHPLRTFFALWPDASVRTELTHRAQWAAKATGGRATRPELLHLTLVFVGATMRNRLPDLIAMMDSIDAAAFVVDLNRCGWFRQNGAVWNGTGSTPDALLALQRSLAGGAERLGFSLDVRPYSPHLTLARDASRGPPTGPIPSLRWHVDSLVLVSSHQGSGGPRYDIVHERRLRVTEDHR